jgi:hypothetical protein
MKKTILQQLTEAKELRLIYQVAVWGDSIYIGLNNKRPSSQKDKLIQYFQKQGIPVEHLTQDSILIMPIEDISNQTIRDPKLL